MNQDYFLSNLVKSHFKEKCRNHNYGCKETFLPQELEEHYTKCSYEFIECPNYDKGCYSKILRKDIYKHKKECYFNSCPGFRYGCCFVSNKDGINLHKNNCNYYKIGSVIETNLIDKFNKYIKINQESFKNIINTQINLMKNENTNLKNRIIDLENNIRNIDRNSNTNNNRRK